MSPAPSGPEPAQALAFLAAIGKDPARTLIRSILPGRGSAIEAPFSLETAHRFNDQGRDVYFVTGDHCDNLAEALAAIGAKACRDEHITACRCFFVEWDTLTIAEQLSRWRELGLPEPTVIVSTGGKSIHCYWRLREPITPEQWAPIQSRLIDYCEADTNCKNPSRIMRLPGFLYRKTTEGTYSELLHTSDNLYSPWEIESCIPDPEPDPQPTLPHINPLPQDARTADGWPVRGMDQITAALALIPPRFSGSYETHRNVLWGLIKAVEEAGGSQDDAIALMEGHSPSKQYGWNIEQVARSGGEKVNSGTFWYHAAQHGYDLSQGRTAAPDPTAGFTDQSSHDPQPPQPKRKPQRRRLAPAEIIQKLPEALGAMPRLNTRTRTIAVGDRSMAPDEISRHYLRLSDDEITWPKEGTTDAFAELAAAHAFDPVADYLNTTADTVAPLPLEQWERLDQHLLGIDDEIAARFLPQYLISAVARTFRPGCGVRRSLVLIGAQQRGKSELGRILFGSDYWVEGIKGRNEADTLTRFHRAWGVELAEMNGVTRRHDQEALKAMLTEKEDTFRRAYGKGDETCPRRFVFWCTSNGPPLRDMTGSTRFVCVPIPDRLLPLGWAATHRDALWSRAVEQFRQIPPGLEPWDYVSEDEREAIKDRNADHQNLDPWADRVEAFLKVRATSGDVPVRITDLLTHLEVATDRQSNAQAIRARELAEALGWRHGRRKINGEKLTGLWPAETGDTPGTPRDTPRTPPGCPVTPPAAQSVSVWGHPGHTNLQTFTETEREGEAEGEQQGGNTRRECLEHFGVSGVSPAPNPLQRNESEGHPRGVLGVSPGVSPSTPAPLPRPSWLQHAIDLRLANPKWHWNTLASQLMADLGVTVSGATVREVLKAHAHPPTN